MATAASLTTVQKAYIAYYGRPADPIGREYWATALDAANGNLASIISAFGNSAEATTLHAGQGTAALVNSLYQQMFGRDAEYDGLVYWVNRVNGGTPLATVMFEVLNAASGTDATALANKLAAADLYTAALNLSSEIIAYSGDAAAAAARTFLAGVVSTVPSATSVDTSVASMVLAGSPQGQTFTLTVGNDAFTGSSGNDTFNATLNNNGIQTLNAGDILNGGSGTDTLSALLNAGYTVTPATLTSIEQYEVSSVTSSSGLSLFNASGSVEKVTISGTPSTITTSVTNIPTLTTALYATGNAGGATFSFLPATVSGSADAATVNINQQTGTLTIDSGIETLTLAASTGTTNSISLSSGASKIYVTGAPISMALGTAVSAATVDASGQTAGTFSLTDTAGAANITGGAGNDSVTLNATTGTGAHVFSGGTGNDSVTIGNTSTTSGVDTYTSGTGNVNLSGGDGNDTFTFVGGFDTNDTVDGGAGTNTLVLKTNALTGFTSTLTNLSNIQKVTFSDQAALPAGAIAGNVSLKYFGTGVNTLTLTDLTAAVSAANGTGSGQDIYDSGTFQFNAGTSTFNFTGLLNNNITFGADGTGTSDALTFAISNYSSGAAANAVAGSSITSTNIETLTITNNTRFSATSTNSFGGITATGTGGADTTVKFTGYNVAMTGAINAKYIDASGITSSSGTETGLTMSTASGSVTAQSITGSAGQDTLYGGGGADTISGGAGNDSIIAGAGIDTISGGAGNDTIQFATAGDLTTADTVDGGDGTDFLKMTTSDSSTISAGTALSNITNIEGLSISDALANNIDALKFGGVNAVKLEGGLGGARTVSNLAAAPTLTYVVAATMPASDSVTMSLKTDTSADTLAVTLAPTGTASNSYGSLVATQFETVTIASNAAAGNTTTTSETLDLGATSGTTSVTLTGTVALTSTISSTVLATLDASSHGAGVYVIAAGDIAALTATGSAYADTILGGGGADSITGGDGNDSLIGSGGADTILGGGGDDTIDGGSGADSLVGGAGADTFLTSLGADTLDGGDGTDILKVSNGVYNDISAYTLSGIETLNMNSVATTMKVAEYNMFTTFANASGITFSDAGTVTANTAVTSYTLAAGANAFTANGSANFTVNGAAATASTAQTFNFLSTYLDNSDAITGGSSTSDSLNVTGNTAVTITGAGIDKVEQINFANTTTAISITRSGQTTLSHTTGLTSAVKIDASSQVSGAFSFTDTGAGSMQAFQVLLGGTGNGVVNFTSNTQAQTIIGGAGNDTFTGGSGADSITGSTGNDIITGGSGADYINVSTGTDNIVFATANQSATKGDAPAATFAATGDVYLGMTNSAGSGSGDWFDLSGFTTGAGAETYTVSAATDITVGAALNFNVANKGVILASNTVAGDFVSSANAISSANIATALALVITAGNSVSSATNGDGFVLVKDTAVDGTADVAIFWVDGSTTGADTNLAASEVTLIGVMKDFGTTVTSGFFS